MRNDLTFTALSDEKCLFFVFLHLCISVAGFDAIFDLSLGILGWFFNLHIVKATPCKRLGFLILILTFYATFYVVYVF